MREVIQQLTAIRRRARLMLFAQGLSLVLTGLIAVAAAVAAFDYMVRVPSTARMVLLIGIIVAVMIALWRLVWPAIAFSPSLVDLALRVERLSPTLAGRLASGVEFALAGADRSSGMAARAVADAERRVGREKLAASLAPKRTVFDVAVMLVAVAVVVIFATVAPTHASIAAQRVFAPLSDAQWPKRTGVDSLTSDGAYPLGRPIALRAEVTKGFDPSMRVVAHYRVRDDGSFEDTRSVVLTHQRDQIFERMIEVEGSELEVWFTTSDDRTATQSLALVPPPAVMRATLTVTPPPYAADAMKTIETDLGPGVDQRAVSAPAALRGSTATLEIALNKPLPTPTEPTEWSRLAQWTSEGERRVPQDLAYDATPDESGKSDRWVVRWRLDEPLRLALPLIDEYGIPAVEQIAYGVVVVDDQPPAVAITQPVSDLTVLPTAVVEFNAEARDDVRVEALWLDAAVTRPASDDPGVSETLARVESDTTTVELTHELEVARFDPQPGEVIEVVARADDIFELNGADHEPVASTPRRLRIITDSEFVEQVYRDLSAIRDRAIRSEEDQRELRTRIGEEGLQPNDDREQARITQRIGRQREILDDIESRLRRNRFEDEELLNTLDQARRAVDEAGEASTESAESLAAANQTEDEARADELTEQATERQREVENALARLADALDRGEDSWAMRREIERLAEDQRRLMEETEELTEQTRGRQLNELSEAERDALRDNADRQAELARRAGDLSDEMRDRADAAREEDPELAESLEQAAERAEEERLEQEMQQASQEIQRNQGRNASRNQQSALDTLSQMLDQLEQTERARAERLQRQLASIVASLEALIEDQEGEIDRLTGAPVGAIIPSEPMIQLNRNTYAVFDLALAGGREMAGVATLVDSAASAQEDAIVALRDEPARVDDALEAEQNSLARLIEAKDLAEQQLEQMQDEEQQRKKQELLAAYVELLARQVALRQATAPVLDGAPLDRRGRMEARRLAQTQDEIRADASAMLDETQDLAEAIVFRASHERIDDRAGKAVTALRDGSASPLVGLWQRDVEAQLVALVEALRDSMNDSEFQQEGEAQSGGGGGGQGAGQPQPLIPPVAQLKLLRGIQSAVYDSTRQLDEIGGALDPESREARFEELARDQAELVEMADALIQEMQQSGGNTPPPSLVEPEGPVPPVEPGPGDAP
ncbi:MAG: hypothetical protein ACF8PN_05745 [Phycisphaerales bacterium]